MGREHSLLLAKRGAKVVVADFGGELDGTGRSKGPADDVVKEIEADGGEAVACYADVSDAKEAAGIIESPSATSGGSISSSTTLASATLARSPTCRSTSSAT